MPLSEKFPRLSSSLANLKGKFRRPKFLGLGLLFLVLLYVAVGEVSGTVNNTPLPVTPPNGGSAIIEKMARGIERELDSSGWTPSRSPFQPAILRFDLRGFQSGVQMVLIKLVQQANNRFTREGRSSEVDADIRAALNNINRANVWSIIPANSTYYQYRQAVAHLDAFNRSLSEGKTAIDPRIDTLGNLTTDLAALVGDEYTQLKRTADETGIFSLRARERFYRNLGVLAATCWAFEGIKADYEAVLKLQAVPKVFEQASASACVTLGVKPLVVMNGQGYGWAGSNLRTFLGDEAKLINDLTTFQHSLAAAYQRL